LEELRLYSDPRFGR